MTSFSRKINSWRVIMHCQTVIMSFSYRFIHFHSLTALKGVLKKLEKSLKSKNSLTLGHHKVDLPICQKLVLPFWPSVIVLSITKNKKFGRKINKVNENFNQCRQLQPSDRKLSTTSTNLIQTKVLLKGFGGFLKVHLCLQVEMDLALDLSYLNQNAKLKLLWPQKAIAVKSPPTPRPHLLTFWAWLLLPITKSISETAHKHRNSYISC